MNLRVAMLSEHASPVDLLGGVDAGGQNVYVDAVSRGLGDQGIAVDVFTRRADDDRPEVMEWAPRVRVIHVEAGPRRWLAKDGLWPLMPVFREHISRFAAREGVRYDLVHGNFWMSGWVAAELGAHWDAPMAQIFHATGVTKLREQGGADTSPSERIAVERAIVRAADRLIAQCPVERDELIADYDARAGTIALIPSAVDIERFRPVEQRIARRSLDIDPEAEIIVYVGRLVPRKDVRNVVQALNVLRANRAALGRDTLPTLVVVGGETEEADAQATPEIGVLSGLAHEFGVADHVRFVGRHQADELHLWYSAADVAVTTPWYEPFGLTPLEAMACGTPVIGSRVGGIAFTVVDGETGFLVAPRDPESLSDRIECLLQDSDLRLRMGRAGRARVEREFTWPTVATRTARLFADMVADRATPSRRVADRLPAATGWRPRPLASQGVA
jgi:glycosyltransferase involved in cell wall biosynthesis